MAPGGDRARCASWPASSSWGARSRRRWSARAEAERHGYRHSFDMLGEAARTDGRRRALPRRLRATRSPRSARAAAGRAVEEAPGISVKLSALHPRYEMAQRERVMRELLPSLLALAGAGARRRHRLHDRRRGSRPARTVARHHRGAGAGARAGRLGRARPRRAGLSEAGAAADRLARRSGRGGRGGG